MKQAHALFRRFHCFPAPQAKRQTCGLQVPPVLVQLGRLKGLIYGSDRGKRGDVKTYIHFMETPPLLTCDPSGRQLYIVGGKYRVTARGIEG